MKIVKISRGYGESTHGSTFGAGRHEPTQGNALDAEHEPTQGSAFGAGKRPYIRPTCYPAVSGAESVMTLSLGRQLVNLLQVVKRTNIL